MNATNTQPIVTATNAGDGGEAMDKSLEKPCRKPNEGLEKPADAGWYVAVVRVNCEVRIADSIQMNLNRDNIWFDYWVPKIKVVYVDKRSLKRKVKEKIFLSTFIFCHVSKKRLDEIRFRPDVYKMLTMPGQTRIYQIPDQELANYRYIVDNPDIPVHPHSGPLKKGQKVRITEGTMAGVVAYVQRTSGKKVLIGNEIKYISGATIEIDRSFLEAIE